MLAWPPVFAPADYAFELPPERIAQTPAAERDASRLLHLRADGTLADHLFPAVVDLLPADAVVIANDTRVIPARVLAHKPTGGAVELLFLEPEPGTPAPEGTSAWRCLARARRALRAGQQLGVDGAAIELAVLTEREARWLARGRGPRRWARVPRRPRAHPAAALHRARRPSRSIASATRRCSRGVPGAVAAPTAGLHMTPAIAERLRARGVTLATVTLHVGWGTFAPIREDDLRQHRMHRERYDIPAETAALVASGRPIVALGTTALRALEAAAIAPRTVTIGPGATDLFIYPGSGHTFRVVDHLITNFHLPESTLLMLVCAFAGTERVLAAYRHAVAAGYRFFSYGDAMLLHRAEGA